MKQIGKAKILKANSLDSVESELSLQHGDANSVLNSACKESQDQV